MAAMDSGARRALLDLGTVPCPSAADFLPALGRALGPGATMAMRMPVREADPIAQRAASAQATPGPGRAEWRWGEEAAEAWRVRLAALAPRLPAEGTWLFTARWHTLGPLRLAAGAVVPRAMELADTGLGCLLTDRSGEAGLALVRDEGARQWRLVLWGEWSSRAGWPAT